VLTESYTALQMVRHSNIYASIALLNWRYVA